MELELTHLRVEKVIAHQIFPRDEEREIVHPKISSELTQLDGGGLNTFQDRIIAVLGQDSHCLEMSIRDDNEQSAYWICSQILDADDEKFKRLSIELANKLTYSQTSRRIPGGIILIFTGQIGAEDYRYVGIIKAELHEGFSIQEYSDCLLLQYISDLLLTPQQKLYKVAMFIDLSKPENRPVTPSDFKVLIYDHNMARFESGQAAQYFYDTFLGCTLFPTNKKLTSDFFYATKEFIEKFIIDDDETVLDLNTALHTYLKVDQASIIDVSDFAQRYINQEVRDNYQNFMAMKGFPQHTTPKDISYIKNKLRQRNLKFTSDVKIVAPSDNFTNLINIVSREDGKTIVAVKGHMERDD